MGVIQSVIDISRFLMGNGQEEIEISGEAAKNLSVSLETNIRMYHGDK